MNMLPARLALACLLLCSPLAAQTPVNRGIESLRNPRLCLRIAMTPAPPQGLFFCKGDTTAMRASRDFHRCKEENGAQTDKLSECLIGERGWTRDSAELLIAPYREEMRKDSASGDVSRQFRACGLGPYVARIRDCLIHEFGWKPDSAERFLEPRREQMSRDSTKEAWLASVPPGMMPCVAAYDSTILVFPVKAVGSGTSPVRRLGGDSTCMGFPIDMVVNRRGELYVLSLGPVIPKESWRNAVTVFASGDSAHTPPRRRILVPPSDGNISPGIGLDRRGNLYVTTGKYPLPLDNPNEGPTVAGAVRVYSPDADSAAVPVRVLAGDATRLENPTDVGFDSHGVMYVANSPGRITVFDGEADDNASPRLIIEGPHTGLGRPARLALGPGDTLFVLNRERWGRSGFSGASSITVYAPGSTGDVAPVRTLVVEMGSSGTGRSLFDAQGLAVDGAGVLYVATWGTVAVFAPGARGDVGPVRVLKLGKRSHGDRSWGRSIALDGEGTLYVSSEPVMDGW